MTQLLPVCKSTLFEKRHVLKLLVIFICLLSALNLQAKHHKYINDYPSKVVSGTIDDCSSFTVNLHAPLQLNCFAPPILTATASEPGTRYAFYGYYGLITSDPTSNTAAITLITTYTVVATSPRGYTATAKAEVRGIDVDNPPNFRVGASISDTITCAKPTIQITAGAPGFAFFGFQGPGIVSRGRFAAQVNKPGTYTVTANTLGGCMAQTTVEVPRGGDTLSPIVTLSNNGPLSCDRTTVTLTATGGIRYRFDGRPPSTTDDSNSYYVTKEGTYSVVVTGANSCTASATTTVTSTSVCGFALLAPTYNCTTGAFHFNIQRGDGTPIEYYAVPGITGWTTNPDQFVDLETRTAPDAQPIVLRARQSGKEVTYVWDIRAQCPIGDQRALRLIAPTYDCTTGAFRFSTSGGDGNPIEYMAIGITGWTTTPNQFVDVETRTAADAPVIILKARQNGREVTYDWNIRAVCPLGSFRVAALEPGSDFQVRILGNPVSTDVADIEVSGGGSQRLEIELINLQGRIVHRQTIRQAESVERIKLPLADKRGLLLLRVRTSAQSKTIKLFKE